MARAWKNPCSFAKCLWHFSETCQRQGCAGGGRKSPSVHWPAWIRMRWPCWSFRRSSSASPARPRARAGEALARELTPVGGPRRGRAPAGADGRGDRAARQRRRALARRARGRSRGSGARGARRRARAPRPAPRREGGRGRARGAAARSARRASWRRCCATLRRAGRAVARLARGGDRALRRRGRLRPARQRLARAPPAAQRAAERQAARAPRSSAASRARAS